MTSLKEVRKELEKIDTCVELLRLARLIETKIASIKVLREDEVKIINSLMERLKRVRSEIAELC